MQARLIDFTRPVQIDPCILDDLDIMEYCHFFLPKGISTRSAVEAWLKAHLTCDAREIDRRGAIIGALLARPESLKMLEDVYASAESIERILRELDRKTGTLAFCTNMLRLLESYTGSVRALHAELSRLGGQEALAAISAELGTIMSDARFAAAERCLSCVKEYFEPLRSASVGVNINSEGNALDILVTDINRWDRPATGLFGDGDTSANSLFDSFPNRERGAIVHLEAYIVDRVEREWARPLARARRELSAVDLEPVRQWLELALCVQFFIAGLRLANAFLDRGCPLCTPEPSQEGIEFESLYYPHMALVSESGLPVAHTGKIERQATTVVTGANNSGKTSYLKAIAQSCLLAQLGFPVPAKRFRLMPAEKFLMLFSAGEDRGMLYSRFQQEAQAMQRIAADADEKTLVLFNEPFTATNPVEAVELLCDTLERMAPRGSTQVLVTHLYDVYYKLRHSDRARVRSHVTVSRATAEGVRHTYRVQAKEPDGRSYARIVARQFGLDVPRLVGDPDVARQLEAYLGGGEQG